MLRQQKKGAAIADTFIDFLIGICILVIMALLVILVKTSPVANMDQFLKSSSNKLVGERAMINALRSDLGGGESINGLTRHAVLEEMDWETREKIERYFGDVYGVSGYNNYYSWAFRIYPDTQSTAGYYIGASNLGGNANIVVAYVPIEKAKVAKIALLRSSTSSTDYKQWAGESS